MLALSRNSAHDLASICALMSKRPNESQSLICANTSAADVPLSHASAIAENRTGTHLGDYEEWLRQLRRPIFSCADPWRAPAGPPTRRIPRPALATRSATPRAESSSPCCGNHAQAADTVPLCSSLPSRRPSHKTAKRIKRLCGSRSDLSFVIARQSLTAATDVYSNCA